MNPATLIAKEEYKEYLGRYGNYEEDDELGQRNVRETESGGNNDRKESQPNKQEEEQKSVQNETEESKGEERYDNERYSDKASYEEEKTNKADKEITEQHYESSDAKDEAGGKNLNYILEKPIDK
jgi:hypothetical protein